MTALWWIISGAVATAFLPWLVAAVLGQRIGVLVGFAIVFFAGFKLVWQLEAWSTICSEPAALSDYCAPTVFFSGPPPSAYALLAACVISLLSTLALLFEAKHSHQRSGVPV